MFRAIADGFGYLFGWLGDLFGWLLRGILAIFQPLIDLIAAIFYFLYKIGVVLVMIIELVFNIGRLLIGLLAGLFATLTGLNYTGKPANIPAAYQDVFNRLQPIYDTLQLDIIATLMQWVLWIMTAFIAVKIIGNMRGGGSSS